MGSVSVWDRSELPLTAAARSSALPRLHFESVTLMGGLERSEGWCLPAVSRVGYSKDYRKKVVREVIAEKKQLSHAEKALSNGVFKSHEQ